jgi:type IV pilus assembly protein PilM
MKKGRATPEGGGVGVVNPDGHVIGLDIGATAVRAVVLSVVREPGQPLSVEATAEAPLPDGIVVDGEVANQAALTKVLKDMWRSNDLDCRQVVIGISHPQVVVRSSQMPNLAPEQLAKALPFQAKDIIALPIDEALLDFEPLGDSATEPNTLDGLLIAAPRRPIVAAVRAAEAAGLLVARVDLSSFAALRAAAGLGIKAEAVIDLGAQVTNIVIHHRGIPRVVRTLPRGGQQLTARLADRTGIGLVEAEILKREVGLVGANPEVVSILHEALRPLIAEIRGSIQYFSSTNSTAIPERLSLTGGGAGLPGLASFLAGDTGLETSVASPVQHVQRSSPRHVGKGDASGIPSAVAVGLAIGAAA